MISDKDQVCRMILICDKVFKKGLYVTVRECVFKNKGTLVDA